MVNEKIPADGAAVGAMMFNPNYIIREIIAYYYRFVKGPFPKPDSLIAVKESVTGNNIADACAIGSNSPVNIIQNIPIE